MAYLKKLLSLKDVATSQLAINLCQDNHFKEVAMCLEKPITENYLWWYSSDNFKKIKEWDTAIDKQCERLTEGLPRSLKHGVQVWITRIAFEYSSYIQRMELLFEVPRYLFMNILTLQDWTETTRIKEIKLAKKLLTENRLTVWQRYRIACVYCLNESIPHLWNGLTSEEKWLIIRNNDPCCSLEKNNLVLLWSYFMYGRQEEKVTKGKKNLWAYATLQAVKYGNQETLMQCWRQLDEDAQKDLLVNGALQALETLQNVRSINIWRENLVLKEYCGPLRQSEHVEHFNLPYYYSELMLFFLSKMSEEQRLTFFMTTFEKWRNGYNSGYSSDILNHFLEWPLQDHFLPTVNSLWGVIPKDIYGNCLLALAEKYSGDYNGHSSSSSFYKKQDLNYDYRSLLQDLWETTPEEYKQYVFSFKKLETWGSYTKSVIEYLLPQLLMRSPLEEKDLALFKRIWHDVPLEERKTVIYERYARNICVILVQEELYSFLDCLLEECLPAVEIPNFKLKFSESSIIPIICFNKLAENREKYVEDFINWAFESDIDKLQFKYKIIKNHGIKPCSYLLSASEYTELKRIFNFCSLSEERKLEIKIDIVRETCRGFLKNCVWEQMDRCIDWVFDDKEKINNFKNDLFYADDYVYGVHHELIFNPNPQWDNVESLYKWFSLSPKKIMDMKKETVFSSRVIDAVHNAFCGTMDTKTYEELDVLVTSLRWCLTDEEMVISFKEEIEKKFCDSKCTVHNKNTKKGKKMLGYLVSKLLQSFKKEVDLEEKSSQGDDMSDKGEKKRLTMEDDKFISTRKRFKKTLK